MAPASADAFSGDRYDLEADEARGGHTLERHVGRTDAELRDRLAEDRGISTASTYATRALAERTIARTLRANADRVQAWTARRGNRPNLALDYRGPREEVLGRSIRRGGAPVDCRDAVVVLRWHGDGFYVLTSYPEASRSREPSRHPEPSRYPESSRDPEASRHPESSRYSEPSRYPEPSR